MVYAISVNQQAAPQLFEKAYERVIASWVLATAEIKPISASVGPRWNARVRRLI